MICPECQAQNPPGQQFCVHCGQPLHSGEHEPRQELNKGWRLAIQSGPDKGRVFPLGFYTRLGRGPENDIQILDAQSSRKHCVVRRSDDGTIPGQASYVVLDQSSTNGTYLNGQPIQVQSPLHIGDMIVVGGTQFLVKAAEDSCQHCGMPLSAVDHFCRNCGQPRTDGTSSQVGTASAAGIPAPVFNAQSGPRVNTVAVNVSQGTGSFEPPETKDRRWLGCAILAAGVLFAVILLALGYFMLSGYRISF
jgi:hypothetical protein